jgi:hypothetical protein
MDSSNIIARAPRRSALASGLVATKSASSSSSASSSKASAASKLSFEDDEEAEF